MPPPARACVRAAHVPQPRALESNDASSSGPLPSVEGHRSRLQSSRRSPSDEPVLSVQLSDSLKAIHDAIADDNLTTELENLPEVQDYDFVDGRHHPSANIHQKMLFLGEEDDIQTWAQLKIYTAKPDEVVFLRVNVTNGTVTKTIKLDTSPMMYPFRALKEKGTQNSKRLLGVPRPVHISTYEARGGVDTVQDMHSPSTTVHVTGNPSDVDPSNTQDSSSDNHNAAGNSNRSGDLNIDRELSVLSLTPYPSVVNAYGKRPIAANNSHDVDDGDEEDSADQAYQTFISLRKRQDRETKKKEERLRKLRDRLRMREKLDLEIQQLQNEVGTLDERSDGMEQEVGTILANRSAIWLWEKLKKDRESKKEEEDEDNETTP
ncbi:hypothetical protein BDV95DRAFT_609360 [Massariosphaeria phaeospora]|uniref:Uncharacterized protein n=1 Tax=Massariosphaeria phaeospora TaxID=100035 RepID=A0A7C8M3H4_9PLEO|nr:hypothetical protein BDV95DRAFT_609360 [Massariosphaeria phaeospora]